MELGEIWQEYGLGGLEQNILRFFPETDISLRDLLGQLLAGDVLGAAEGLFRGTVQTLTGWWNGMTALFVWLLILGVISAMLGHFVEMFDHQQIADLSFYFLYLLLMTLLIGSTRQIAEISANTLEELVSFVQVLLPSYLMAVGLAGGTVTVGVSNQLMLLLIYVVENLLARVVIPLIYGYVMLAFLSGIWSDERLSLLLDLAGKAVSWILKGVIGGCLGMSVCQSVLTPALDSVQSGMFQRAVGAIPGMGGAADGVMEMAVGSAVIIKNSIGVLFLILMLALCAVPLIRIFLVAALLKAAAALMGIVSDRRLTLCTDRVAAAGMMLFRTTGTALLLFLTAVALIAATTNRGF